MSEKKYKVKITGENLNFEGEVSGGTALEILRMSLNPAESVVSGEGVQVSNQGAIVPTKVGMKESPAEYFKRVNPIRFPDKILAAAGYLSESEARDVFSVSDIKRVLRDSRQKLPANFNRDFRWAIKNGWVSPETDKDGFYYVTNNGLEAIKSGFSES